MLLIFYIIPAFIILFVKLEILLFQSHNPNTRILHTRKNRDHNQDSNRDNDDENDNNEDDEYINPQSESKTFIIIL